MSLRKRRSLSESRKIDYINNNNNNNEKISTNQLHQTQNSSCQVANQKGLSMSAGMSMNMGIGMGLNRRRTSAEMISEAKNFLKKANVATTTAATITTHSSLLSSSSTKSLLDIVNSVKVVHTRRPITPRETTRLLYGRVLLAERPPSAVSLRYLQNEYTRGHRPIKSPTLEPIPGKEMVEKRNKRSACKVTHDTQLSEIGSNEQRNNKTVHTVTLSMKTGKFDMLRKLPALEQLDESVLKKIGKVNTTEGSRNFDRTIVEQNNVIDLLNTKKIITQNVNDLLAQSTIEKLVEMLKEHAGLKECSTETVAHINSILIELYERIKKEAGTFKKAFVLSGLYGLVECTAPKILLAVAKIVLALHVSGSNLTGACKLIFKVSRNEQNDHLFHDNDVLELLIDGLGRASPLEDPEACIYGYGAIRFLTASTNGQETYDFTTLKDTNSQWTESRNHELPHKHKTVSIPITEALNHSGKSKEYLLRKLTKQNALGVRLAQHGAIQLMVLHLQMLNETAINKGLKGRALHSLYQLTAALRAMADINQYSTTTMENLLAENEGAFSKHLQFACPHLIKAAEVTLDEIEVQSNIIRTLSILSEDSNCCQILHNYAARLGILLGPYYTKHQEGATREKILSSVSRLGYILGNIMAIYDNARLQFYYNDVAMEYLINILDIYAKEMSFTTTNPMDDNVVDVLIKIIRIIANMSVNTEVGQGLCVIPILGDILLKILDSIKNVDHIKMSTELDELMLACLGALHNLCFYQEKSNVAEIKTSIKGNLQNILITLIKLLEKYRHDVGNNSNSDNDVSDSHESREILVEVARVFGNLTRNEMVRQEFCQTSGLQILIQLLNDNNNGYSKSEYDLKVCIVGILVNILGDANNRKPFIKLMGADALLNLLKDALLLQEEYQQQQQQQQQQQSNNNNNKQPVKWFLATIICQAFWNLFVDITIFNELYVDNILKELFDLLLEQIQQQHQQEQQQQYKQHKEQLTDNEYDNFELWENFHMVAVDLLDHLQKYIQQKEYNYNDDDNAISDDDEIYIQNMQNFQ